MDDSESKVDDEAAGNAGASSEDGGDDREPPETLEEQPSETVQMHGDDLTESDKDGGELVDEPAETVDEQGADTHQMPGGGLDEDSSDAWSLVEEADNDFEETDDTDASDGSESSDEEDSSGAFGGGLPSPGETGDPVATDDADADDAADSEDSNGLPDPEAVAGDDTPEDGSGDDEPVEAVDEEEFELEEIETEDAGSSSKPPELPERPPDVKGSRETPDEKLTLKSGQTVGGRFTVERYLGSSGGGISYLCREDESGRPVVIKVLAIGSPDEEALERIRTEIRTVSQIRHDNLTDILGMGRTEDGQQFVAMNFVQGDTLSKAVADQRERGREIGLVEVFHVLAHLCEGLKAVHERTAHGVLTPYNVYLVEDGSVQVQNLGFGRVAARYLQSQGEGPFVESIYIAPEVRHDPTNLTPRADIYSLGMIAAELLSGGGLPRDVDHAHNVASRLTREFGESIHQVIEGSLEQDPNGRITSAGEFRMALDNAIEQSDVDPAAGLPDDGLPVAPAVDVEDEDEEADLFDIPGPSDDSAELQTDEEGGDERYLVRKDGLDYGPFTREAVLEQLYDDEIDEHTSVLDRTTQKRDELGELEAFREEVEEYIPKREERRRKEAERRAEIERKVKKGGKFVLVVGIIAGLFVLAGMSYYYFTRPEPQKMPMDETFVAMDDYKFLPPPKEFQTVSADKKMLKQIFNPEADKKAIAERMEQSQGGGGGSAAGGGETAGGGQGSGGESGSGDDGATTVDMGSSSGDRKHLGDKEINDIIMSNWSALRRCVQKELKNNPGFSGVTVKFFIRPKDGSTGGVTLKEKQYLDKPVGRCLVQEFRQMDFPAHSAINNKGVTFPLRIQR